MAGGQLKTYALSNEIKISKEMQFSMNHNPRPLAISLCYGQLHFSLTNVDGFPFDQIKKP
jgi:hypothetical protein